MDVGLRSVPHRAQSGSDTRAGASGRGDARTMRRCAARGRADRHRGLGSAFRTERWTDVQPERARSRCGLSRSTGSGTAPRRLPGRTGGLAALQVAGYVPSPARCGARPARRPPPVRRRPSQRPVRDRADRRRPRLRLSAPRGGGAAAVRAGRRPRFCCTAPPTRPRSPCSGPAWRWHWPAARPGGSARRSARGLPAGRGRHRPARAGRPRTAVRGPALVRLAGAARPSRPARGRRCRRGGVRRAAGARRHRQPARRQPVLPGPASGLAARRRHRRGRAAACGSAGRARWPSRCWPL